MSQNGYTPIQLYRSPTSGNVPSAANLADGELALNIADRKMFIKGSGGGVVTVGGGATGGGADSVFYENGMNVTTNYTLSANTNAMSTGPITIDAGVSVTIPSGQRWVVL